MFLICFFSVNYVDFPLLVGENLTCKIKIYPNNKLFKDICGLNEKLVKYQLKGCFFKRCF